MKTLAFTGHRPNKLGGYGKETRVKLFNFAKGILLEEKPDLVISGMAQGWDHAVAVAAIKMGIPLKAAVPFLGQEGMWPAEAQRRYNRVLEKAAEVVIVSEGEFSSKKMMIRNEWMVDRCGKLIALWDGTNGGTSNCVRYARKQNVETDNMWEQWRKS